MKTPVVPNSSTPIARRLRRLHRAGKISHATYCVADTLLWSCGAPGNPFIRVSYDRLADLAGVARSTVAIALKELKRLGVLTWEQTRIRVKWRSLVSRNIYRFLAVADTESDDLAADYRPVKKGRCFEDVVARLGYHPPIRTVAEMLAILANG